MIILDNKDDNKEIKKMPRKKKEIIESEKIIKEEQIKSKDEIKKKSNQLLIISITAVITMFIVLLVWYLIYGIKPGTTGNIEFVKNVNITENGIADSVEKGKSPVPSCKSRSKSAISRQNFPLFS